MNLTPELIKESLKIDQIADGTMKELLSICSIKTFNVDDILSREDEDSDNMYIVLSGLVDIQYMQPTGKRETIDSCVKGDLIGWSSLVKPYKTSSIDMCRAQAEVLALNGTKLREICDKDTDFGYTMMSRVARVIRRRLQAARKEILQLR